MELCQDDLRLGTVGRTCREGFDFSVLLEQAFFGITPNAIFLVGALVCCIWYNGSKIDSGRARWGRLRMALIFVVTLIDIALLATAISVLQPDFPLAISTASVQLVACIVSAWLSIRPGLRRPQVATLLELFWTFTTVFNAVRLRTVHALNAFPLITGLYAADVGARAICLILQSCLPSSLSEVASSEECAGFWARRFFVWLNTLFNKGYHVQLDMNSLPPINSEVAAASQNPEFLDTLARNVEKAQKFSLIRAVIAHSIFDLLAPVLPRLLFLGTTFAQPFLINKLLGFVDSAQESYPEPISHGYGLIGAFGLTFMGMAVFSSTYWQYVARFDAKIQGLLVSAIFNSTMISDNVKEESALTLLSVDLTRISTGIRLFHEFWAAGISVPIAMYLLYLQLGYVFVAPLIVVCGCIAFSSWMGSIVRSRQLFFLRATQQRLTQLADLVRNFKCVKMIGYDSWFENKITNLRAEEVNAQKGYRRILLWTLSVSQSIFQMSSLATFTTYAIIGRGKGYALNAQLVFTSLAIMKLITSPLLETLQYIAIFASSLACVGRVESFIVGSSDELSFKGPYSLDFRVTECEYCICINSTNEDVASQNVTIRQSSLAFIYGDSGSGKSTIMNNLAKAIISSPTARSQGIRAALCAQESWFWTDTIRANIIGTKEFEPDWYTQVLHGCCLDEDINAMEHRDESRVGSGGTALSGGQKKRVTLARAVYAKNKVLILDDIFAGLDGRLETTLFKRLFGEDGLLRSFPCTVFLTTSSEKWLSKADVLVQITSTGSLLQLDPRKFAAEAGDSITHAARDLPKQVDYKNEKTMSGEIIQKRSGGADSSLYTYYLESIGVRYVVIFFTGCALTVATTIMQAWWLKEWASSTQPLRSSIQDYLPGYFFFTFGNFLTLALFFWQTFERFSPRASLSLHAKLLGSLVNATVYSITSLDMGVITNRFSQDITLLDGRLASSFLSATLMLFTILANIGLFIAATPYFGALVPVLGIVLWAIQRVYLRTSRQLRVLDLEARSPLCTHLSDILSGRSTIRAFGWEHHFLDKTSELTRSLLSPFYLLASVQNWLTLVLDLVAAAVAALIAGFAVALRHKLSPGYLGLALTGVMDLGFYLRDFITEWTQLEANLGCVARIRTFTQSMTSESSCTTTVPIEDRTPISMSLVNVSASWSPDSPATLHEISVSISAGTRVALVGRSGSGKSSLAALLLGLLRPRTGTHLLGDVDVSDISLSELRSHIAVLPQEQALFGDSLREVLLPPDSGTSDGALKTTLQLIGIWDRLCANVTTEGEVSDSEVLAQPIGVLSAGERQLLCVARTLLKPRGALVMDEAGSLADKATSALIHKAVHDVFADATIISVSHHLDTILDYDQVVVMDAGRIKETGVPTELLRDKQSAFHNLYWANNAE